MSTIAQLSRVGGPSKPDPSHTKLVIRRLPPTLPEEVFWKSVEPWISEDTTLWKRYVPGEVGDDIDGHATLSRAYVLFKSPEPIADFRQGYDGHVFRSKTGEEFQAVIEHAPIQKTPYSAKVKVDARQGTIEDDPDYKSFLESLKMPAEKSVVEVSTPISQPTTTPLLEHLMMHGKGGKGSKKQKTATASSSDVKGRALASINAAAAKRARGADSGPILVAGKGREVTVADSVPAPTPAPSATGEKKKRERKKRDKAPANPAGDGSTAGPSQPTSQGQHSKPPKDISIPAKSPRPPKPKQERRNSNQDTNQHAGNRGTSEGEASSKSARGGGRGGRGGRRGGGAGAGGERQGEGKDRSAQGPVVSILSRNAEGGEGREGAGGRGRGRGRGRGGGQGGGVGQGNPLPAVSTARIDD